MLYDSCISTIQTTIVVEIGKINFKEHICGAFGGGAKKKCPCGTASLTGAEDAPRGGYTLRKISLQLSSLLNRCMFNGIKRNF